MENWAALSMSWPDVEVRLGAGSLHSPLVLFLVHFCWATIHTLLTCVQHYMDVWTLVSCLLLKILTHTHTHKIIYIDSVLYAVDIAILCNAPAWKYPQITFESILVYKFWHTRHCHCCSGSTYFKHFGLKFSLCVASVYILLMCFVNLCAAH